MKKMTLFCIAIWFIASATVMAIEPVEFEVMYQYEMNMENNSFGYNPNGYEAVAPSGLLAYNDSFYVWDSVEWQLVRIHPDGSLETVAENSRIHGWIYTNGKYLFTAAGDTRIGVNDLDSGQNIVPSFMLSDDYPVSNQEISPVRLAAIDNLIFSNSRSRSNQPQYHSFEIVDDFESPMVYRTPEETVEYIQNEYDGEEDLRFDDDGYLFWGGRLVAPDGDSFGIYHWGSVNVPEVWRQRAMQGQFVGWDSDDNSYWSMGSAVVVVSSQGELVAEFFGENVNRSTKSQFTMTEDGTLYVLSYNGEGEQFELMKLERFW